MISTERLPEPARDIEHLQPAMPRTHRSELALGLLGLQVNQRPSVGLRACHSNTHTLESWGSQGQSVKGRLLFWDSTSQRCSIADWDEARGGEPLVDWSLLENTSVSTTEQGAGSGVEGSNLACCP